MGSRILIREGGHRSKVFRFVDNNEEFSGREGEVAVKVDYDVRTLVIVDLFVKIWIVQFSLSRQAAQLYVTTKTI